MIFLKKKKKTYKTCYEITLEMLRPCNYRLEGIPDHPPLNKKLGKSKD